VAFSCRQITLVASTATPCLVAGTGTGTTFVNIVGNLQDPLPVSIKNEDASAVVWWGGSDVSATKGQSIAAGSSVTMNLYGASEIPYVFSTGTPIVSVLCGRQ
jgi:hypothetical protein